MVDIADGTLAQQFGFQRGDVLLAVNGVKIAKTRDLRKGRQGGRPRLAHHHPARRPADFSRVRRMTSRPKRGAGPSLFAAAGLDNDAPRPLADKLRPQKLADVVGQDHLLGPDGALTRMLDSRSLGSLIFWGPPGTGKTTVARLLAARDEPRVRADQRDLLRRAGPEKGVRRGPRAARDRAGHAAVRRRNPPLQPRPAGQLPAGDGGRHHRARRRHHREPVVRADRADAVAGARAGVQVARCRCGREAAGARRGARGQEAAARRRCAAVARPHGRRRRPRLADARRGNLARGAARRDLRSRRRCRRWCSGARRSTTRSRTATTT